LRQASRWLSLISPKYSTGRCTARPSATRRLSTMLQYRWSLPSFWRGWQPEEHDAATLPLTASPGKRVGLHYRPDRACRREQLWGKSASESDKNAGFVTESAKTG
jgi:hypothetical protein